MDNKELIELKKSIEQLKEEQKLLIEENQELKLQNEALRKQADIVVDRAKDECRAMELAAEKNIYDKWIVFQKKLNVVLSQHKEELKLLSENLPDELK